MIEKLYTEKQMIAAIEWAYPDCDLRLVDEYLGAIPSATAPMVSSVIVNLKKARQKLKASCLGSGVVGALAEIDNALSIISKEAHS